MTEHTRDTESIRIGLRGGWAADSIPGKNSDAEFDRWLAAHDEQVARNVLLEWADYQEDQEEVDAWVKAIRYYANYKYPEQTP